MRPILEYFEIFAKVTNGQSACPNMGAAPKIPHFFFSEGLKTQKYALLKEATQRSNSMKQLKEATKRRSINYNR